MCRSRHFTWPRAHLDSRHPTGWAAADRGGATGAPAADGGAQMARQRRVARAQPDHHALEGFRHGEACLLGALRPTLTARGQVGRRNAVTRPGKELREVAQPLRVAEPDHRRLVDDRPVLPFAPEDARRDRRVRGVGDGQLDQRRQGPMPAGKKAPDEVREEARLHCHPAVEGSHEARGRGDARHPPDETHQLPVREGHLAARSGRIGRCAVLHMTRGVKSDGTTVPALRCGRPRGDVPVS